MAWEQGGKGSRRGVGERADESGLSSGVEVVYRPTDLPPPVVATVLNVSSSPRLRFLPLGSRGPNQGATRSPPLTKSRQKTTSPACRDIRREEEVRSSSHGNPRIRRRQGTDLQGSTWRDSALGTRRARDKPGRIRFRGARRSPLVHGRFVSLDCFDQIGQKARGRMARGDVGSGEQG